MGSNQSPFPSQVILRAEAVPYSLESVSWNLAKPQGPFLKEPALSEEHVSRGLLQFDNDTNNAIAVIWDQPKQKLYVDLNRDLDLTDDPAGVFTSTNKGLQQVFTNVTLPVKTPAGLHPATLDLHLFTAEEGKWAQVQLHSRSLWQAKVALDGKEWQVAAVDQLFGREGPVAAKFLLLRPWAARTNRVSVYDAASGSVRFPNQLFLLGHAFHLERRFETQDGTSVCKLDLTPQQPPLVELKVSGEALDYGVFCDTNGYTLLISEPPAALMIPQGTYTASTVWLKKGSAQAFRLNAPPLVVKATAATNLVLGGPLTNSVILARSGRRLVMDYQLKGADGGPYRLAQAGPQVPPEFTVFRDGKKVVDRQVRVWLRRHLRVLMASTPHAFGRTQGSALCGPGWSGHQAGSPGDLRLDDAQPPPSLASLAGGSGPAGPPVESQPKGVVDLGAAYRFGLACLGSGCALQR